MLRDFSKRTTTRVTVALYLMEILRKWCFFLSENQVRLLFLLRGAHKNDVEFIQTSVMWSTDWAFKLLYCHHDLLSWERAIGFYCRITRGLCGSSQVYSVLRFVCSAPIGRGHLAGGRSCIFCAVATCPGESELGLGWRQAATWGSGR